MRHDDFRTHKRARKRKRGQNAGDDECAHHAGTARASVGASD
ncbi:hypothetical protein BV133_1560 [Blastochloris viridis]|uniref:Uncharacterized protein n=1 Tax=Blastochloris viridis TaxID=1079 RepID=A0A182D1W2_BLAVI|nr:hypothetical protein BV133_1560 [Blastochloris viridis]